MKHQDLASALVRMVYADDVVGAKGLLVGIDEQDKKMIAAKAQKDYAPLCIATELGSKDMVEFLVKDCQANIEEGGNNYHWFNTFHSLTPLWYAACNGRFDMVKLLQELGADINTVSHTETTSVNNACSKGEFGNCQISRQTRSGYPQARQTRQNLSDEFCSLFGTL